jgi:hypothetical protein
MIAPPSNMARLYLIAYNLLNAVGWFLVSSQILGAILPHLNNLDNIPWLSIYVQVDPFVCLLQLLGLLEILHATTGLVKGNPLSSVLLHGGRDLLLVLYPHNFYGNFHASTKSINSSFVLLYLIWAIGENIRYPFYLLQLLNVKSFIMSLFNWLRYTIPLILLPLGFTAELFTIYHMYHNYGYSTTTQYGLLGYSVIGYLTGAPFLWQSILKQRNSKLRESSGKAAKKSE